MIEIRDTLLYAAFQEVDTRLQRLVEGEYEREARHQRARDGMDFARHCNTLVVSYNEMLDYFQRRPNYAFKVHNMKPVERTFRPM